MIIRRLTGLWLLGMSVWVHAADFNQTFNDAKSWGAQQQAGIPGGINLGTAQSKVPNYQPNSPATSYYNGGNNALFGLGASKVSDCSANPNNPQYTSQECNAVNTIAKSPSQRPKFNLQKTDPIFQAGGQVLADPSKLAGSVNGTYSGCTTQTVTIPATYDSELCTDYIPTTNSSCAVGRNVTIDPSYVYQCLVTNSKIFSSNTCQIYDRVTVQATYNYQCTTSAQVVVNNNCSKQLTVSLAGTNPTCTQGAAYDYTTVAKNSMDTMYGQVVCNVNDPNNITFQFYAAGGKGACAGWQTGSAPSAMYNPPSPRTMSTARQLVTVTPNWDYACRSIPVYEEPGSGCDANGNCTYHFHFGNYVVGCQNSNDITDHYEQTYDSNGYLISNYINDPNYCRSVTPQPYDAYGYPLPCPSGTIHGYAIDANGYQYAVGCYYPTGSLKVITGWDSYSWGMNMSFTQPMNKPVWQDTWSDQCATYEQAAQ